MVVLESNSGFQELHQLLLEVGDRKKASPRLAWPVKNDASSCTTLISPSLAQHNADCDEATPDLLCPRSMLSLDHHADAVLRQISWSRVSRRPAKPPELQGTMFKQVAIHVKQEEQVRVDST